MDEFDWAKLWQQAEAEQKAAARLPDDHEPQEPQTPEEPQEPQPPEEPPSSGRKRKKRRVWVAAAALLCAAAVFLAAIWPKWTLESPFGQYYEGATLIYDTDWFSSSIYGLAQPFALTEEQVLQLDYRFFSSYFVSTPNWNTIGTLEETQLTKENFDDWFTDEAGEWSEKLTPARLRRENVNAWAMVQGDYVDTTLWPNIYLLQQRDGTLYLVLWENELEIVDTGLDDEIAGETTEETEDWSWYYGEDGTLLTETECERILAVVELTDPQPLEEPAPAETDGAIESTEPDPEESEDPVPAESNGSGETGEADPEGETGDDPNRVYELKTILMQAEGGGEEPGYGDGWDVQPFEVLLALPYGWSAKKGNEGKVSALHGVTTSVYTLYNAQGEPVGKIGFGPLMGEEDDLLDQCGVLTTSGSYAFDLEDGYVLDREWDSGFALVTTVRYSAAYAKNLLGVEEEVCNWGFLLGEADMGVFVAMELSADAIDQRDADAIAQSFGLLAGIVLDEEE